MGGGRRTQVQKEIVVAKLTGRRRCGGRGDAHPGNQLCAGNRSRRWEPTHPSCVDQGSGTRGSGEGFPTRPSTLSSTPPLCTPPRPVPGSSFLPLQVRGDKCPPRRRALDRNLRGADRASGGSYRSAAAAAAGPPAGAPRSLFQPLHARVPAPAPSCPSSGDAILAPGV